MDRVIELPYGACKIELRLPEANLAGVFTPQPVEPCAELSAEVQRALADPLDCPPLSALPGPGENVVILLEDHTRPTPTADLLPWVLDALVQAGVRDADITQMFPPRENSESLHPRLADVIDAKMSRDIQPVGQKASGLTEAGRRG